MLKLKLQYFGHLMRRSDSLEKTLMLGKIEGRRRRGWQRMRWLDGIMDSMTWVWVNSGSWWWTGRPDVLWFMGSQRVRHDWVTELNWKSRGITFPKKVSIVKAMVFPIVMCQSENWNIQFNSVAQSCPTLCDPMNHITPGLPVHHQLPESTQTHVHWVGDAIQPSHTLLSPSPPAFNLSQPGFFPKSQFFVSGSQSIRISIDRRK